MNSNEQRPGLVKRASFNDSIQYNLDCRVLKTATVRPLNQLSSMGSLGRVPNNQKEKNPSYQTFS